LLNKQRRAANVHGFKRLNEFATTYAGGWFVHMTERVTLRDVAEKIGMHFSTVSLALRGDARIAEETRKRVCATAAEMGYRPDAMLSALSSFRHGRVKGFVGTTGYLVTEPADRILSRRDGHADALRSAREESERVGMKLDVINVNQAGMAPGRVTSLLDARGIRGLILAPLPTPGAFISLPWERFSCVALGYSVTEPGFHRACLHQARTMRGLLRALRGLGYERIGLIMELSADLRTDHHFLGSYLAEAQLQSPEKRVAPLLAESHSAAGVRAWFDSERPDCVVGCEPRHHALMLEAGVSIPDECGFSLVGVSEATRAYAGMNERWDVLGESAVSMLLSLLRANDQGIPDYPRFSLVEGRWVWGPTVRKEFMASATKSMPRRGTKKGVGKAGARG
jgi:DNA-binding LacI/PurR family transcriptional regulator